jgi:HEAT repeat protein
MELGPECDLSTTELFARARAEVAAGDDDTVPVYLVALHQRPTRLVFDTAESLLFGADRIDRLLGVRVLRELGPALGHWADERPFKDAATAALLRLLDGKSDPVVIGWVISALGYQPAPQAASLVASFADHPQVFVRFHVAAALPSLADEGAIDSVVLDALARPAADDDAEVRYYALTGLIDDLHVPVETTIEHTVRERLTDPDLQVREAVRGYLAGERPQP